MANHSLRHRRGKYLPPTEKPGDYLLPCHATRQERRTVIGIRGNSIRSLKQVSCCYIHNLSYKHGGPAKPPTLQTSADKLERFENSPEGINRLPQALSWNNQHTKEVMDWSASICYKGLVRGDCERRYFAQQMIIKLRQRKSTAF